MEVLKMEEPISKKMVNSNNSKSLDSSLISGNKTGQQSELEKIKKQLFLTRGENMTLQKELSASMKEDADNRMKIAELTKKLKEFEKKQEQCKPYSPAKTKKDTKQEEIIVLEQKIKSFENKNRFLEDKLKRYEEEKDINREKQEIIDMQKAKINELEELLKGKETCCDIDKIGDVNPDKIENDESNKKEEEFQKVMMDYDIFLRKVLTERQTLITEKNTAQKHLANLETAFNDLLQKYERAKKVVEGFKSNEEILKTQMNEWNKMINMFNKKYNDLKSYAEKKISEANLAILNKDKGNIEEVAKLKAKILQSQVRISELEKQLKPNEIQKVSLFAPLKNNIKKKH